MESSQVPPLIRQRGKREINFEENARLVRHFVQEGISRFIYGGNTFLCHVTLAESEQILRWLSEMQPDELWFILSAGPSYGRFMDQARRKPLVQNAESFTLHTLLLRRASARFVARQLG